MPEIIDRWDMTIYAAGSATPERFQAILRSMVTTGPKPEPNIVWGEFGADNPRTVYFKDPAGADYCLWTDTTDGPLASLPAGPYEATLTAVGQTKRSKETARVKFVVTATAEPDDEIPVPEDFGLI